MGRHSFSFVEDNFGQDGQATKKRLFRRDYLSRARACSSAVTLNMDFGHFLATTFLLCVFLSSPHCLNIFGIAWFAFDMRGAYGINGVTLAWRRGGSRRVAARRSARAAA